MVASVTYMGGTSSRFLWPIILLCLVLNLYLVYLPCVFVPLSAKWIPVKRLMGRLTSLTMRWHPLLFDLQGAFLCLYSWGFLDLLFSHQVVSDPLWLHELQHARLPCLSLALRLCSNSCPLSQWCHPTISSSVTPSPLALSLSQHENLFQWVCLHSFPAWGSFPMSCLFTSGGQSIGASASASALPMNIQDWFPLGLTDLISLLSKGLSRVFSSTTV